MNLRWRVLWNRLRYTGILVAPRLVGLTLAALLAAAVPTFVAGSMQQVLHKQVQAAPDSLSLVLNWTAGDTDDHSAAVSQLDDYLRHGFPADAGIPSASLVSVPSTGPGTVQQIGPDGRVTPTKRYLKLGVLAPGVTLVSGRLPAAGAAEVVMSDLAMARAGYTLGDKLRVPLTATTSGPTVTLTLVGTINTPAAGPLANLKNALDSFLLTSQDYWQSLKLPPGSVLWALDLPGDKLQAAGLPALDAALRDLPLRAARMLPEIDLAATPQTWVSNFLAQMATTEQLLVVLLLPILLLVVAFVLATANMVVSSRRVEVAVLRSRGASPMRVLGYYTPESLLLAGAAAGLALLLTAPTVKLMGLCAGFLKLVDRPLLPVTITASTALYAALTALLAEAISLVPLVRTAQFTVATMNQEGRAGSPVLAALQVVAELALLGIVGYGTWRLGAADFVQDPLFLALPALALAGAGVLIWRVLTLTLALVGRLAGGRLSPALYLALGLLRSKTGRHQALWLMLVITTGLGIYGAAFARTLDRDLVALAQYRTGSDLLLRPAWESEIVSYDAEGNPTAIVYREPPYSQFQGLPEASATARVQTRKQVSLSAGTRNLGKTDVLGISPQEFGRTARFLPELTTLPPAQYLNAMARDERAVLVSLSLAQRLGIKPGDRLKLTQNGNNADMVVAGTIAFWPGRLPEDGDFLIGSLDYLQDGLGLMPYDIWVRLAPGASAATLVQTLHQRGAGLLDLKDRQAEIATSRRQPMRLGLYATLSVGFATALFVMALTYLLSVGRTLQSRAKELGVLRAMGMSSGQVAWSLYAEQLLLVGTAAATGLAAGQAAASLYVPLLRQQPGQSLLPLQTASSAGERLYLALGLALALAAGAGTVALWLRRFAIGKALRLGEDG